MPCRFTIRKDLPSSRLLRKHSFDGTKQSGENSGAEAIAQAQHRDNKHPESNHMSNTVVQPYLFFGGRCQEAMDFYKQAIGAQVDFTMHYQDSPEPMPPGMLAPGWEGKVMHTTFRVGGSTLMGSDGCGE